MKIIKTKLDEVSLLIKPVGRIDVNVAAQFEHEVNAELEGIKYLTFDFAEVMYISSLGLRVILEFQKKMEKVGYMKLTNVSKDIKDIFAIVGFDKIINIE